MLQEDADELQTVKTQIRLLLEEQSDLGLHCLPRPICPKTKDHYSKVQSVKQQNLQKYISCILLLCEWQKKF